MVRVLLVALVGAGACAAQTTPTTQPDASASAHDEAARPAASNPAEGVGAAPSEPDAPQAAPAHSDPSWLDPLPALSLSKASEDDQARLRACFDAHGVLQPDASAADLLAGAECARKLELPGPEIRLYKQLLTHHPASDEAVVATRQMGTRYEQIDVRPEAIRAYRAYLKRYPKQPDARALGQRAACLARGLGDEVQVGEIIADLDRLYGRRGFVVPNPDRFEKLCSAATTPAP